MHVTFPFKEEKSPIFGKIYRPVAEILFRHTKIDIWQSIFMIVDTGADYTLLPKFIAPQLGVNLLKDCRLIKTYGVGGKNNVYLLKERIMVKLGEYKRMIPVGFLADDHIPPLLGRLEFLETFRLVFEKFTTTFE